MIYVGVGLHLRLCFMTVLDARGAILRQGRVPNDEDCLRLFFTGLKSPGEKEEKILVAVEACGFWCAFVDVVEPLVERVVLVHPAKVKAIASAKLKNDRDDSVTLAHRPTLAANRKTRKPPSRSKKPFPPPKISPSHQS